MNLILIRGLSNSGKTTLANKILATLGNSSGWEADKFFECDGEYKFDRSRIGEAHAWCLKNTDRDLENGFTVVVSNTFTTKKELKPYFDLAFKYRITPTVITCHNQWGSIHNVPLETMNRMKERFEYDISDLVAEHHQKLQF